MLPLLVCSQLYQSLSSIGGDLCFHCTCVLVATLGDGQSAKSMPQKCPPYFISIFHFFFQCSFGFFLIFLPCFFNFLQAAKDFSCSLLNFVSIKSTKTTNLPSTCHMHSLQDIPLACFAAITSPTWVSSLPWSMLVFLKWAQLIWASSCTPFTSSI